jgi:dolichol-phosphate mannosyltransferase
VNSASKTSIVLATYNEAVNLEKLIPAVRSILPHAYIIIVDDNSPDGTPALIQKFAAEDERIVPLIREGKMGYGSAVLTGFGRAIELGATQIATLDADFSHDPRDLPALLLALDLADISIGSRYFKGVRVLNWHPSRLLLSLFANRYVKVILGLPAEDCTSGFRAYRGTAIEALLHSRISSQGYSFLVEVLYTLYRQGLTVQEVPIIYSERREGQSKMSKSVIREAMIRPWLLRLSRRTANNKKKDVQI